MTSAALARRRLLLRAGGETIRPDGTAAGQYGFSHALYREVIYDQVPVARRRDAHLRVALREEAAFGAQGDRTQQQVKWPPCTTRSSSAAATTA